MLLEKSKQTEEQLSLELSELKVTLDTLENEKGCFEHEIRTLREQLSKVESKYSDSSSKHRDQVSFLGSHMILTFYTFLDIR